MATLVFDIETVGDDWDSFDGMTQKQLTRWIDTVSGSEAEYEMRLRTIKDRLGFSPFTGRIVAIGIGDLERVEGVVYVDGDISDEVDEPTGYQLKSRTETEMLEDFWEGIRGYDTVVTFNGRRFDVPFLLHRSVVCGVRPTVDLLQHKYIHLQKTIRHVDLQDQLSFYGAMQRQPSLHLCCRAYGIESPKDEHDGYAVTELFREKKFRDLARYNAKDVIATTALYEKWLEYLAPPEFLNNVI